MQGQTHSYQSISGDPSIGTGDGSTLRSNHSRAMVDALDDDPQMQRRERRRRSARRMMRGLALVYVYLGIAFAMSICYNAITPLLARSMHEAVVSNEKLAIAGQVLFVVLGVCVALVPFATLVAAIRMLSVVAPAPGEKGNILGLLIFTVPLYVMLWTSVVFGTRMFAQDVGAGELIAGSTFVCFCPILFFAANRSYHADAQSFSCMRLAKKTLLFVTQTVMVMAVFGLSRYFAWVPLMEGYPAYAYKGPMCIKYDQPKPVDKVELSWGGEWGCPAAPSTHCMAIARYTKQPQRTIGPNGEFFSYPSKIYNEISYAVSIAGGNNTLAVEEECDEEMAPRGIGGEMSIMGDCVTCTIPQIATYEATDMLTSLLAYVLFYGSLISLIEASPLHQFLGRWYDHGGDGDISQFFNQLHFSNSEEYEQAANQADPV